MTNMYVGGSPLYTMVDSTKGSMTNRVECAKEHMKNNFKTSATIGATGLGFGLAYSKGGANWLARRIGDFMQKFPSLEKVVKNPVKAGKFALIAVPTAIMLNTLLKGVYKNGQIDQKYTDLANIERQKKAVIVDA